MTKVELLYQREGVTVLRLVSCPVCHGAREVGLPAVACWRCCCQTCGQVCEYPPECRDCASGEEAAT